MENQAFAVWVGAMRWWIMYLISRQKSYLLFSLRKNPVSSKSLTKWTHWKDNNIPIIFLILYDSWVLFWVFAFSRQISLCKKSKGAWMKTKTNSWRTSVWIRVQNTEKKNFTQDVQEHCLKQLAASGLPTQSFENYWMILCYKRHHEVWCLITFS